MQSRLRSLYQYTMCKLIPKPVARTVGVSSESLRALLERHQPAGGTATPAGVPIGSAFVAPIRLSPTRWSVLEEFSERIRGKGVF